MDGGDLWRRLPAVRVEDAVAILAAWLIVIAIR
jgi:uncharacterized membrane protein